MHYACHSARVSRQKTRIPTIHCMHHCVACARIEQVCLCVSIAIANAVAVFLAFSVAANSAHNTTRGGMHGCRGPVVIISRHFHTFT